MNNISEEEMRALQVHLEVETSTWKQLRRRILIRGISVLVLIAIRALLVKFYPENYTTLVFKGTDIDQGELVSLVTARLGVSVVLAGIYLYALATNSYLRTVSILALMVPVALIWGDLQMFLLAHFPTLPPEILIGFGLRLVSIYLLARNYIDIRR